MRDKKLLISVISILAALLIPIILFGFNFNSIAFNNDLYKKEFSKYGIYSALRGYDIDSINNKVLNYLMANNGNELIDADFFNEREKAHLLDVKNLIHSIFKVYYFSAILFLLLLIILVCMMDFKVKGIAGRLLIIFSAGSLLALLVAVLFFALSSLEFNFAFDTFHKTFFSPGTYTFNPKFEGIVVLYPEKIFFDLLAGIILSAIFSSVILLIFPAAALFIFFKRNLPILAKNFPSRKTKKQKL